MSQVDKQIIRGVLYVLQSSKDWIVRQEGLEAVSSIARALLPELIHQRYQFIHPSIHSFIDSYLVKWAFQLFNYHVIQNQ